MDKPVRLGGLALENGVLVHGPTYWACAIRTENGDLKIASGRKPFLAADVGSAFLRGPARLGEVFALMPVLRRALPEARLPYERPSVATAVGVSTFLVRRLRASRLTPSVREVFSAAVSLAPAAYAIKGTDLAAYHGAEHIAIGSYEHGEPRTREHERCGSHMVGPLIATSIAGSLLANAAPRGIRPVVRIAHCPRSGRRVGRALHLDGAQPGHAGGPRPRLAGARASAARPHGRADARAARGR